MGKIASLWFVLRRLNTLRGVRKDFPSLLWFVPLSSLTARQSTTARIFIPRIYLSLRNFSACFPAGNWNWSFVAELCAHWIYLGDYVAVNYYINFYIHIYNKNKSKSDICFFLWRFLNIHRSNRDRKEQYQSGIFALHIYHNMEMYCFFYVRLYEFKRVDYKTQKEVHSDIVVKYIILECTFFCTII